MRNQEKEIATIKERTIKLKLSDADCERLFEKAYSAGITPSELIENFIGDLLGGTYSNGSDERMHASEWFDRCWFGMFPNKTFMGALIDDYMLDEFASNVEFANDMKENIKTIEKELADSDYKWQDIMTYSRNEKKEIIQCYATRQEWEEEQRNDIAGYKEDLEATEEKIKEVLEQYKRYNNGEGITEEEAIDQVTKYMAALEKMKEGE